MLCQSTCESVSNTCEISMRALLSCFSSFSGMLISKISPIVTREILVVFVNALTANGKYPVKDCENLALPIQTQLSKKRKTFSHFVFPFLEYTSNFNHFEKRMIVIGNVFPKLQTGKSSVRTLSKKCRFRTRIESQHVKASQVLAKSP